jgi:hypothetical protein
MSLLKWALIMFLVAAVAAVLTHLPKRYPVTCVTETLRAAC